MFLVGRCRISLATSILNATIHVHRFELHLAMRECAACLLDSRHLFVHVPKVT